MIYFQAWIAILKLKFIYSEKATKFCEISTFLWCASQKSKVEISQNFVAFSEYMNFNKEIVRTPNYLKKSSS